MEKKELQRLLHDIQEQCGSDDDLVSRYRDYEHVDDKAALRRMQERMHPQAKMVTGSVSMKPASGAELSMLPGQKLTIGQGQPTLEEVDTEPYVAWNTGMYSFDGITLEQLMDVLSRWYDCRVTFRNEASRQKHFTGSLDRYATIRPTLEAIGDVTGLTFDVKQDEIIIH